MSNSRPGSFVFVPHRLWLGLVVLGALAGCSAPEPGPAAKPVHQSRAKVQFDRAVLTASLDSLTAWHEQLDSQWARTRRPGRSRTEIDSVFADVSYRIPEELLVLWRHHDGASADSRFDGWHRVLGSVEAHAVYDSLRGDLQTRWRHNWIPVMRHGDDWVAVESSRREAPGGPVVIWRRGSTPEVASTNLTCYFAMVVRAAQTPGALKRDAERSRLGADPSKWTEAHAAVDSVLPFLWSPNDSNP